MGLYNAIFGRNKDSSVLLEVLGFNGDLLGKELAAGLRLRDVYPNADGTRIILYTRNGGGNREHWGDDLTPILSLPKAPGPDCACYGCWITHRVKKHPLYVLDRDDDYDETYAYVEFSVPAEYAESVKVLATGVPPPTVAERFDTLMGQLNAGERSPDTDRAMEVGRSVLGAIEQAPSGAVITVGPDGDAPG